jgi:hypothetical protein
MHRHLMPWLYKYKIDLDKLNAESSDLSSTWRWGRYISVKHRFTFNGLHSATFQDREFSITKATRTSNPAKFNVDKNVLFEKVTCQYLFHIFLCIYRI